MRVVCHVQHQRRLTRQHLKTPRQRHLRQPLTHRLRRHRQPIVQRLQHRQHRAGIHQLIDAAQRRVSQARQAPLVPAPLPLLAVTAIRKVAPHPTGLCPNMLCVLSHATWRHRVAHHHHPAGAHDAGFFPSDLLARIAQPLGVIHVNACDQADIGVNHVYRV